MWAGVIASGSSTSLPDSVWTALEGSFTFPGGAAGPFRNTFYVLLKVNGRYSVNNLLIDDVSVREEGCRPVNVTEVVSNTILGHNVTGWADDFALNEQKIFRLTPTGAPAFMITRVRFLDPDTLRLEWDSAGEGFVYTVEESDSLRNWQASDAAISWPISSTEAEIPAVDRRMFFRVKAQPGP